MMPIFCAICFIATTVALTASPPSLASLAALVAMPSTTLAFSVFCEIDAVMFHRRARLLDARGLLAGALRQRLRRRADFFRCARQRFRTAVHFAHHLRELVDHLVHREEHAAGVVRSGSWIAIVRSPSETWLAISATKAGSPPSWRVSERVIAQASANAIATQPQSTPIIQARALAYAAAASLRPSPCRPPWTLDVLGQVIADLAHHFVGLAGIGPPIKACASLLFFSRRAPGCGLLLDRRPRAAT